MNAFLSIDAESNGLYGQAFSIAAARYNSNGEETDTFIGRCPIEGKPIEFVANEVLPVMQDVPITHSSYDSLLEDFIKFYKFHRRDTPDVIAHVCVPVEARLFIDAFNKGFIDQFEGPHPLTDIAAYHEIGVSVDTYLMHHNIRVAGECSTHNPLYDSRAAAAAYVHYMQSK